MLSARFSLAMAAMLIVSGCVQTGLPLVAPPDRPIDAVVYDRPLPAPLPGPAIAPPPPMAAPLPPPGLVPVPAVIPVAGSADQIEPAYTLDAGDKLRVTVFGQEGLSNSYSVDTAGRISIPLIGTVPARGLTTTQLSHAIAARLRNGYIREPHVAVEVEAYRPFFILGEVTYPGQYPFVAHMTVETAVAIAGGFTPRAFRWDAEVTRPMPEGPVKLKAPPMFLLQPGDTIVISERWF